MSRARDLSKLSNPSVFSVDTDNNVGINSTSPDAKLDVIGIVSATSFFGDGSGLTGIANTAIIGADQINVTGVVTATSFVGNVTGNATGLTGTPDIAVRNITGVAATFTGVLTYEDVTNIDSVGVVTARTGIKVLAGGANIVGVTTAASGVDLNGTLREKVNVTAGKLSDNLNIDLANGMVHLFTTAESTTAVPNIRVDGSTSLNSVMAIGESVVVTLITTANASAYSAQMTIDGAAQTERWIGGSAPSDGGSSGVDIHTFTIIKTADATFTVIGNHSKTS